MDLVKRLEEYRDRERGLQWEGTFAQYFEIATKKHEVAHLSQNPSNKSLSISTPLLSAWKCVNVFCC